MPEGGILSLNDIDIPELPQLEAMDAEQAYCYSWTASLIDDVLDDVRQYYSNKGMETHWLVFSARVVIPIKDVTEVPSLKTLCQKYTLHDEQTVSGMIANVKRRFRATLERKLHRTQKTTLDINDEINRLKNILLKKHLSTDDKKNDHDR